MCIRDRTCLQLGMRGNIFTWTRTKSFHETGNFHRGKEEREPDWSELGQGWSTSHADSPSPTESGCGTPASSCRFGPATGPQGSRTLRSLRSTNPNYRITTHLVHRPSFVMTFTNNGLDVPQGNGKSGPGFNSTSCGSCHAQPFTLGTST